MSRMPFVNPGDPLEIDSVTMNAMISAANAHAAGQKSAPGGQLRQLTYPCLNESSESVGRFKPVKITGSIIDPASNSTAFDSQVGFRTEIINSTDGVNAIAVTQSPIGPGKIGIGIVLGITPAMLEVIDQLHTHATPNAEGGFDSSSTGPAVILWKESGTGEKRAIIALVPLPLGISKRWVRITGSSEISDKPNQWSYDFTGVVLEGGAWVLSDPVFSSDEHGKALNTIEASNSGSGIQGNGVELANLPNGFSIVPIGDGAVVEISGPYNDGDDDYWAFSHSNLVDGTCKGQG